MRPEPERPYYQGILLIVLKSIAVAGAFLVVMNLVVRAIIAWA